MTFLILLLLILLLILILCYEILEHLGPPPPYSQATEYLQKQRAEQMAVQSQGNILKVSKYLLLGNFKVHEL